MPETAAGDQEVIESDPAIKATTILKCLEGAFKGALNPSLRTLQRFIRDLPRRVGRVQNVDLVSLARLPRRSIRAFAASILSSKTRAP